MTTEREPQIGDVVHVRHGGVCMAAIVTYIDESGPALYVIHGPNQTVPSGDYFAYTSLASARPTSGWHWKDEDHEGLR